jgi:Subtilase family
MKRLLALLASLSLLIGAFAPPAMAQSPAHRPPTPAVKSHDDPGKKKLDVKLRTALDRGSNATVAVFATVVGNPSGALATLSAAHVAQTPNGQASLVVGRIKVQQLPKLASLGSVVSVNLVQLKQTGQPLGSPDPQVGHAAPSQKELQAAFAKLEATAVPYGDAPPLKGSNFEALKKLALLDAKTHDFAEAWKMGYDGSGSTVSILDGGTDWGHPDLLGTWLTGPDGWPQAYDPFDTLVLLVDPSQVDLGLTWYTPTQLKTGVPVGGDLQVSFDTRTGPSRNFFAPDGTVTNTYTFPAAWSKSGTVRLGSHPDDYLLSMFGERPAFLVTDPNTAGVYDTVYVDLNDDHDFSDEKPVTRTSPASYRDMNGDGYTDMSGGLLYYISDGVGGSVLPGGPSAFGLDLTFDPGAMLAWTGDFDPAIGGHGTLTASNVVGQGVIAAGAPTFTDVHAPGHTYPGAVIGGAPRAKAAPMGDIYFGIEFSSQFAFYLTNLDGIDVISNSWGYSDSDNDGFDAASQEAAIWSQAFGVRTTSVHSTGNGAPGYGTTTPPKPSTGIAVGASTQFGGTGWDSITKASQITDNDVIPWSDRGPAATGASGVDVLGDGAYSPGDVTLNVALDGPYAWETWGGTSRSTPVVAGAAALVYQAQRKLGPIQDGFAIQAREILKSSALDLGYDSFTQGSGSVQAGEAVKATLGKRVVISPDAWRPGDYRGTQYDAFPHLLEAGASDSQTFALDGPGTYSISDRYLKLVATKTISWSSAQVTKESPVTFNAPDYLIDLTSQVKAHKDADLMVVRAIYPHSEFDPNADYVNDQRWTMLAYDWTDANHDGRLWRDRNHNGVVNHTDSAQVNIDGLPIPDFKHSDIQKGEYERFTYLRASSNALEVMVRDPAQRMHSGVFLGLSHAERSLAIPVTHMKFQIEFYKNVNWSWLSTPRHARGAFTAKFHVPTGTPAGMYQGAIVVRRGSAESVVPVAVTVPAAVTQASDGSLSGSLSFGGSSVAAAQSKLTYNNGSIFGANDWSWRAESGDWRFFYFDVPNTVPPGTLFLSDTTWADTAPFTDLDTLILGPGQNSYQFFPPGTSDGSPYILDTVGKSANTNIGAGIWTFQTTTGGAEEIVSGPASDGLHAILQHGTGWNGTKFDVPFSTSVGTASVNPASVSLSSATDSGAFDVTFTAGVDLTGLAAAAFGLSQPTTTTETAQQDDPNDPSTASVKKSFSLAHAARATISVNLPNNDIDLYIVRDANNDGVFDLSEIVGSSAGGTGVESVTLINPLDGNYQAWVHGYSVAGTPTFPLTISPVQGNDLTVTGLPSGSVPAGTPVTLHVTFSKPMTSGQDYVGELQLGPVSAPNALSVPIVIHRT